MDDAFRTNVGMSTGFAAPAARRAAFSKGTSRTYSFTAAGPHLPNSCIAHSSSLAPAQLRQIGRKEEEVRLGRVPLHGLRESQSQEAEMLPHDADRAA